MEIQMPQAIGVFDLEAAHLAAGQALGDTYSVNVFPAMNVDWDTYPNHIGHTHFTGCFRCHNDEHESDDGQVISQDCDTCHSLLALEEEILRQGPETVAAFIAEPVIGSSTGAMVPRRDYYRRALEACHMLEQEAELDFYLHFDARM